MIFPIEVVNTWWIAPLSEKSDDHNLSVEGVNGGDHMYFQTRPNIVLFVSKQQFFVTIVYPYHSSSFPNEMV